MLSLGMIRLDGIKNPDVKVPVADWKSSSKPRPDEMCLRDVLHSIKVPGAERNIQVFHGLCRTPEGGFEAAVADRNPIAKNQVRNVASHPAGWILVSIDAAPKCSIEIFSCCINQLSTVHISPLDRRERCGLMWPSIGRELATRMVSLARVSPFGL